MKPHRKMRVCAWLAMAAALLAAVGCGFRMKAPILPDAVQSVSIVGSAGLKRDLEDAFERMGIEVASKAADMMADMTVQLEDYRSEDWQVAFNKGIGNAEAEYSLSVLLTVRMGDEIRLPQTRLQVMRSLLNDPRNPISDAEERRVFGREMREELVHAIIRAMEMAVRNQGLANADSIEPTR